MSNRAWVTLATNDSYGLGALVLAHSLRRVGSTYPTVVLITPTVTDAMRERLRAVFTEVVTVDVLDSRDAAHLALLQRPELGITFTKIHCWGLTQYEKCVFLDADALVVQNCDELFEREELSAAPDVGWPDCFNSGVFVYKPSTGTFDALIKFAQERGSFDGGDQGLLNSFFSDWARGDINKHLPFLYNVTSAAFYSYLPALKQYGQNLKIIHFIGAAKPWLQRYNWETRSVDAPDHIKGLLQLWWDLFVGQVHHQLDSSMVEDVEVEAPPALPPTDVAQHYAPDLDPQSEFRWHHPEAQVPEEATEKIGTTDYYDPWQNYRGNIPPNPNVDASDDRQAVRDYAWEYTAPAQSNVWKPPPAHQHDTNWHNEPHHHQTHSHDHRDHNRGDHSHVHSHDQPHHQTHEHHGRSQEHEAGHFFTSNDSSQHDHHSEHRHDRHGHGHSQYPHDHHYDHKSHHYNSEHPQKYESSNDTQIHQDSGHNQVDVTNHQRLHIVHHVHINYEKAPQDKNTEESELPVMIQDMNGDASETESCDHEDIKPRHPYDNYFLIHRATIDSYGRKICSHEIPPSPSPTPTPESTSPLDSEEETEETPELEQQSGVAGNLARVSVSAPRGDALDELTRRQGWEAGNIDYMGADSFDNIWAKISQTLNQPRTSPPKEPSPPKETPKQPSPPKEPEPKRPSPPKEVPAEPKLAVAPAQPAPTSAPAEPKVAEAPAQPAPAEPKVADSPAQPAPAEPKVAEAPAQPAPAEPKVAEAPAQPAPAESIVAEASAQPAPSEPKVAEAPAQPAPVESIVAEAPAQPAPAEPKVAESPVEVKPAEVPAAAEPVAEPAGKQTPVSPAVEAPAPAVEAPAPDEAAARAPAPTPVPEPAPAAPEAPVVAQAAAPAPAVSEAAAPAVKSPKEESKEKTDVSKVPPTPPATPKSTPEPSSPVAEQPAATPEKAAQAAPSDSPPLAHTPSKEAAPAVPAAKSEERSRKKPAGKLQLSPPAVTDPLATPDSELEDAAALAQSIIAGELGPAEPAPEPVSLAQIGVKPKGKSSTAAQIESSVVEPATAPAKPSAETPVTPVTPAAEAPAIQAKEAPAAPTTEAPATPSAEAPATPASEASSTPSAEAPATPSAEAPATPTTPDAAAAPSKDAPKKKIVKKVTKKEGDAPVPPPRKKEKKPKEK